jgi:hypothetical protein
LIPGADAGDLQGLAGEMAGLALFELKVEILKLQITGVTLYGQINIAEINPLWQHNNKSHWTPRLLRGSRRDGSNDGIDIFQFKEIDRVKEIFPQKIEQIVSCTYSLGLQALQWQGLVLGIGLKMQVLDKQIAEDRSAKLKGQIDRLRSGNLACSETNESENDRLIEYYEKGKEAEQAA